MHVFRQDPPEGVKNGDADPAQWLNAGKDGLLGLFDANHPDPSSAAEYEAGITSQISAKLVLAL
jgi:hypothetical protein